MSASQFLDMQGPARKRMRKGTKSCIECRRRKIRCTYDSDHPNVCNECRSRGSECVDQERGSSGPKVTGPLTSEQSYSLRERVTQLETVVKEILHQMGQTTPSTSASSNHHGYFKDTHTQRSKSLDGDHISNSVEPTPVVPVQNALTVITNESVEDVSITEGPQIENAPVLQILNNNVISSTEGAATRSQNDAARLAISPKAIAVRDELAKLVPPRADLLRIRDMAVDWWSIWIHMFPELLDKDRSVLVGERDCFEIPQSPGDVAKFLLCNLLCLDQLPAGFDCKSFEMPIVPSEYAERCVNAIEQLIVNDEDLCGTLSSLEAILLLSKWYSNLGRPRKSWLVARRAVELAQLAGLHISTAKDPVPGDTLYERRLKLWTMLGLNERYLCILLGLPYAIQDRLYRPQVERRLRTEPLNMEICCLQLSLMMGPIIDRNQEDPAKMSIADTLKLEQEMQNHARKLPDHFWQQQPPDLKLTEAENIERFLVGFMFHYLRAMLHLPFMLQSHGDHRYRFSHEAALESSRNALLAYNRLRSEGMVSPYVCRVIDFQAFSVAMLLIINAIGYSEDAPNYNPIQDEKDWALVNATTEVLRHAESEPSGTVAQQSLLILEGICKNRDNKDCPPNVSCKVTVPYFGSVTVTPRHNAFKSRNERTSSHKTAQNQHQHQHQHQQPQPHPQQHRSNHYQQQLTPSNSSLASQHGSSSSSSTTGTTSSGQPSPFHLYTTPQSVIDFSNVSVSNCLDQNSQQQQQHQYQEAQQNLATTSSIWDDSRVQLENILALPNAGYLNNESNATYTGGFIDSSNSDESLGLWRNMSLDLDLDQGWNLDWLGAGIIP